jgi:hypothetical protein
MGIVTDQIKIYAVTGSASGSYSPISDPTGSLIVSGSVVVTGSFTMSGDIRLREANNAVIRPVVDLILNGTASFSPAQTLTNTTATASYGINVASYITSASYCCRLPQPTKGKSVTFVNITGVPFYVFPSQTGGSINGAINGYYQIPSDGKSYTFDCYENPLPGGWSATTPNGANQITCNSGLVSASLGALGGTDVLAFVSNTIKISGSGVGSTSLNDGISQPPGYTMNIGGNVGAGINPGINTAWKSIDSVTFITNVTGSVDLNVAFTYRNALETYEVGTYTFVQDGLYPTFGSPTVDPNFISIATSGPVQAYAQNNLLLSNWTEIITGHSGVGGNNQLTINETIVSGTFTSGGTSAYTSANPGDPGTKILTINSSNWSSSIQSPFLEIGSTYLDTFTSTAAGNPVYDVYYSNNIGFAMLNTSPHALPDLKIIALYNVTL